MKQYYKDSIIKDIRNVSLKNEMKQSKTQSQKFKTFLNKIRKIITNQ